MTNKSLILAIFLAGALWKVFLFVGLRGYDDFAYTNIALDMLDGRFHFLTADNRYAWRFLLTAPTALAFWLCGVREGSAVFLPFLCSLGNIIVVWLIGRELFNENVGLLAAALAAVFPNSVVYGTMLYPEEI
jgi:4-amino-4-deoxy-L-arabinose transferase-like glycosyltransferase